MTTEVALARQHWEEGYRRLERRLGNPVEADALERQLEAVTDELRKRIGGTFTLRELADLYTTADRWTVEAVSEHAPGPGWPKTVALIGDAAFYLYARGAADYEP